MEGLIQKNNQNPKQAHQNLDDKISNLIRKKTLNLKVLKPHHSKYKYEDVVSDDMNDSNLIKMIDVGRTCKGIVVKKNQSTKQLWIHLTKLVFIQPESKYMTVLSQSSKNKQPQQKLINALKQYAFIKDYDIKEPFSIFTYINSYKDIQVGSEVYGILTRKQKRNINCQGQSCQTNQSNIWFQISIKNQLPSLKNMGKNNAPKYGIYWDQRFKGIVDQSYQKTNNFSITKLALYTHEFQNDSLIPKLRQKLDIQLNQNINPISNIKQLKHIHINFQRIRQIQEKKWANDHFMEGMEFLKRGNNQYAIQNFDLAKKFDKDNEKIFIGKGCALANMNNFSQGLRQIKQALRINPNNEQANQYYKTIRQKLREKQTVLQSRKKTSNHSPNYRTHSK